MFYDQAHPCSQYVRKIYQLEYAYKILSILFCFQVVNYLDFSYIKRVKEDQG